MTEGINWLYENTDGEYADAVPFVPLAPGVENQGLQANEVRKNGTKGTVPFVPSPLFRLTGGGRWCMIRLH